ncbi:MAG TPA: hypothetical protein VMZ00_16405 [Sporichthya sp.]|nr:hypothetical protein [Sporichthya sp.]
MQVRGAAAVLAVALLIGGCSGDDQGPVAASPEATATATPVGVRCSDGTGDSADPSLDLFGVRLARSGKNIRVVFDESQTPGDSPVSWVVGLVSADGKHSVQLTADLRSNGDIAHAITVDDDVRPVSDPVRITAEGMTTLFPVKPIDALGRGVLWYATLSLDGQEIDYCPGGAELREVLDIVPLALPDHW